MKMRLFDEIVDLLSNDRASLGSALLKTKILMHRIGHKELDPWINDELNGYPADAVVPEYRIVGARLTGTLENIARRYSGVTLATLHLPEKVRENLCTAHLGHSVVELEGFATAKDGTVATAVPPELYGLLGQAYDGAHVTNARSIIGATQVAGVLVEIRSRLLDFVLNLQDKIGNIAEEDMKKAAEGINAQEMFNSAVFGANATIIVGSHNRASVSNVSAKGDVSHLHSALEASGVNPQDLEALDGAINADGDAPYRSKVFGPKVSEWMGKMVQKAATGSWQVGIGAAGNLLATALSGYYGHG
ncbi:hypothetical protein [Caballeronia sp. ATUFL_M1_KS5A]|uniref:AbiTii domain-containing protein n=1 Tax=Caballeronia sp. ATUFL_M1_KS5A TaxID=2921778 RepID=UPI00202911CE|nr:hypothetical protein [Caballeronia sp. ATUFL_M1_KS5A]